MSSIRKKCLIMGDFIQEYLSQELNDLGVQIIGPLSPEKEAGILPSSIRKVGEFANAYK